MTSDKPNKPDLTPIDLDGLNSEYKRMNDLRRTGQYVELRFAKNDEGHAQEFEDIKSSLKFYGDDCHIVSVKGLNLVFIKPELATLLGLETQAARVRLKSTLANSSNDNGAKDSEA